MVDRAAGLPATITNTRKNINQGARTATGHAEPGPVPFLAAQAHAEELGQHRGGRVEKPLRQGDRMETADRLFGWNVGHPVPTRPMITHRGHEIDHHAVWITEGEDVLLVAGTRWIRVDPQLLEAFVPVPERGFGHTERCRRRHSGTAATLRDPWPWKEGKQARRAALARLRNTGDMCPAHRS